MSTVIQSQSLSLKPANLVWLAFAVAAIVASAALQSGFSQMVSTWLGREEYSHALMIPVIAAYLIWQQKAALRKLSFDGTWWGFALVLFGAALQAAGVLAALDVVQQYGLLLAIYGLVLAFLGVRSSTVLWAPLLLLALMIPLPEFVLQNFSANLQLISSQIGVWFIRLFDISVFVEGNVIDLGGYKLQVAEACDGLRYLFPLMTLGFVAAYMFRVEMWKRVVLFLSTIPITILMNSFRIGTIGVMVEHWGPSLAEGFLHDFQGWAVFMTSAAVLLAEIVLLTHIGRHKRAWREVFGWDVQNTSVRSSTEPRNEAIRRKVPLPFMASSVVIAGFALGVVLMPARSEIVPQRDSFFSFPQHFENWDGRRSALEQVYLDALKLDDYLMADFVRGDRELVNFYVAWYDSQRAGQSAHSPRSCLPGGGWRITSLEQVTLGDVLVNGKAVRVNRAEIELGTRKQLAYYWFQQRGRVITNEYLVKWYLFWDSLTRKRTDGSLVRLITPLQEGENESRADARLIDFANNAIPKLDRHVPN